MAHKKGGGSTSNGRDSRGKRLGIKRFGGQPVLPGTILVRQRGTTYKPGSGVRAGGDYTLFAIRPGFVRFQTKRGGKRYVEVVGAPVGSP